MVVVCRGRGGKEGGLHIVEPLGEEVVDFFFLPVSGVFKVNVEIPHDEVLAIGRGEFRQEFGDLRASVPGGEVDGVNGEGVGGAAFLDVDCEHAAWDNDILGDDFEAVRDKNGNSAFGAASRGVGSGSVSHDAGGE